MHSYCTINDDLQHLSRNISILEANKRLTSPKVSPHVRHVATITHQNKCKCNLLIGMKSTQRICNAVVKLQPKFVRDKQLNYLRNLALIYGRNNTPKHVWGEWRGISYNRRNLHCHGHVGADAGAITDTHNSTLAWHNKKSMTKDSMSRPCSSEGSHAIPSVPNKQNSYSIFVTRNVRPPFLSIASIACINVACRVSCKVNERCTGKEESQSQGCALRLRNKSDHNKFPTARLMQQKEYK